jgi:hypothetical protein
VVDLAALPVQVVGADGEQPGQGAGLVGALGPSATSRSLRLEKIRSSSTGTAVSASCIRAPSARRGPFVYTGVSWTYRSLTTDGDTTTALASAGTE